MFDIHKVRPIHGWREFIGEVGIIVLGVLIALAFEQAVETVHWRHKVDQTSDALRSTLAEIAFSSAEQQIAAPCIDRQLANLQTRLSAPGPYKPAPAYLELGRPYVTRFPSRNWPDGIWRTANSEGVATHLPPDLRSELESLFVGVAGQREYARQADAVGWRLDSLALPVSDAGERARSIEELSEQRGRSAEMSLIAGQLLGYIAEAGMMPDGKDMTLALRQQSGTLAFCRANHLPLGNVQPVRL